MDAMADEIRYIRRRMWPLVPVERAADLVHVRVLVLEHVGDRGADRSRRPLRPADGAVEVLLPQLAEDLGQGLPRVIQLATEALQRPIRSLGDLVVVEVVPSVGVHLDQLARGCGANEE